MELRPREKGKKLLERLVQSALGASHEQMRWRPNPTCCVGSIFGNALLFARLWFVAPTATKALFSSLVQFNRNPEEHNTYRSRLFDVFVLPRVYVEASSTNYAGPIEEQIRQSPNTATIMRNKKKP